MAAMDVPETVYVVVAVRRRRWGAEYAIEALSLDLSRAWELHDEMVRAYSDEIERSYVTANRLDELDAMVYCENNRTSRPAQ
jgi:hypothetical protein